MMNGYSVTEAASVLGVPTERVWELLARGVLSGAPEGETGMRVFLQPRPAPAPVTASPVDEPVTARANGPERELSPFRELLTEFRNLTERYGQALLALGEARGEVASLRSRVDLLEARIDLRLPMGPPVAPWPTQPPPGGEPSVGEPPRSEVTVEHEEDEAHRRRRRGARRATESFAAALARAEDPSVADLPRATDVSAHAQADDVDRSLPREVLPSEPVLVADEAARVGPSDAPDAEAAAAEGTAEAVAEGVAAEATADEPPASGPPITEAPASDAPVPAASGPEAAEVEDSVEGTETISAEPEPVELAAEEPATEIAAAAPAGAEPAEASLDESPPSAEGEAESLAPDAGWIATSAGPPTDAEEPAVEPVHAADAEEPEEAGALADPSAWSEREPEAEPEPEADQEPAASAQRESTAPSEPPAELEADAEIRTEPEPEPIDFDAQRYTTAIEQPDWFEAEADDAWAAPAPRDETAADVEAAAPGDETIADIEGAAPATDAAPPEEPDTAEAIADGWPADQDEDRDSAPDAPAAREDAPEPLPDPEPEAWPAQGQADQEGEAEDGGGADEMEVAGGGQGASVGASEAEESVLPGSRELDQALDAFGDLGHRPATPAVEDEWPPATRREERGGSQAQRPSGYVAGPPRQPYAGPIPGSPATRAYRRLRRIFPT